MTKVVTAMAERTMEDAPITICRAFEFWGHHVSTTCCLPGR